MTLPQLEALEERRNISIRHARFNAALTTSALINLHRSQDSEPVSPYDFLPGFERDKEAEEKEKLEKSIVHGIKIAFAEMKNKSRDEILRERDAMVKRMKANGIENPEELIRRAYPEGF